MDDKKLSLQCKEHQQSVLENIDRHSWCTELYRAACAQIYGFFALWRLFEDHFMWNWELILFNFFLCFQVMQEPSPGVQGLQRTLRGSRHFISRVMPFTGRWWPPCKINPEAWYYMHAPCKYVLTRKKTVQKESLTALTPGWSRCFIQVHVKPVKCVACTLLQDEWPLFSCSFCSISTCRWSKCTCACDDNRVDRLTDGPKLVCFSRKTLITVESVHVCTQPVDRPLRAALAPPPGTEAEVFWTTSCPIKAPDHPNRTVTSCPTSALPPVDTNTRFCSGGGDLSRLCRKAAVLFCLSCPYLCLLLFVLNYMEDRLSSRSGWRRGLRQNNENEAAVQTLQRLCHAVLSCCIISLM